MYILNYQSQKLESKTICIYVTGIPYYVGKRGAGSPISLGSTAVFYPVSFVS